jgi:predicted permease
MEMGGREILRAARALLRAPRYTAATVVTFALVIGASTLFFAVVHGVLFQPLPYPEPDDVVAVGQEAGEGDLRVTSAYALLRLAEGAVSVEGVAWFSSYVTTLTGAGDPVRLDLSYASSSYFDVVGVRPALGRGFLPSEGGPGGQTVVILSDRLWRTRFDADPALVGRTVLLDAFAYEVVGVMPPDFVGPDALFRARGDAATDVWMPFGRDPLADGPGYQTVRGVARLAEGAALERFREEAGAVATALHAEHPDAFPERGFVIQGMNEAVVGATGRRILLLLGIAAVLVVLVGCANVANLAVGRGLNRAEDRAVRVAIGAGRRHLAAEVGAEVMIISLLGGIAGLGIASLGLHVFLANAPEVPLLDRVRIDAGVVAAAGAITLFATLVGALLPSLDVASHAPAEFLGRGREVASRRWGFGRGMFAAFQVAAAVALVSGALIAHDSLRALLAVDRGFVAEGVRVAQIDLPQQRYADADARMRFTRLAQEALEGQAGIERVAFVTSAPQIGINNFGTTVRIDGREEVRPEDRVIAFFRAITPGYLEAMGIALLHGRTFDERDVVEGTPMAALVNWEFAKRHLAGADPVGRFLTVFGQEGIPIVGVVEDVRYGSFGEPPVPEVYLPYAGRFNAIFLVARAQGPSAEVSTALRDGVHALDPSMPMDDIPTMASLVARSVETEHFLRLLIGTLAALVAVLAVVGTYAVLAERVARRSREFAIRVALGAPRGRLLRSALLRGGAVVACGIAGGLGGTYAAARGLEAVLFGVSAEDPTIYLTSALLMGIAGLTAAWIPARRATQADPLEVLRGE